jgi:pyruvate,water dikinase
MNDRDWIIHLQDVTARDERVIGGKAAKLANLAQAGFRVPEGFCLTTQAYDAFLTHGDLVDLVRMELGRKPLEHMRWEEIWDAALRIRSGFTVRPIPAELRGAIVKALDELGEGTAVAVRSSAPGEDAAERSFAGLHESVVGVAGPEAVLEAVKTVWASLWSDAALLYRKELSLDPVDSHMAVLVQRLVDEDRSGVAFGRDPRDTGEDHMIVEAVPGPCSGLVDGAVDPDRWILARESGSVISWQPGDREESPITGPILDDEDLTRVHRTVLDIESLFSWPPDVEWTGQASRFTVLQARPITTVGAQPEDRRAWYLTLRPSMQRMKRLRVRVADTLIPELEELGRRMVEAPLEDYDDRKLAKAIEERSSAVDKWKQIYWDEFIPFAHGVRQLGTYYNDAVHPEDPYEFVALLKGEKMLAVERNEELHRLAAMLRRNDALRRGVHEVLSDRAEPGSGDLHLMDSLPDVPGSREFGQGLSKLLGKYLDVSYKGERLAARPDLILKTLIEMASRPTPEDGTATGAEKRKSRPEVVEQLLLDAVGPARHGEAREVIATARLSWRLRDDDNILVGRLEAQLLRAVRVGIARLSAAGRLDETAQASEAAAPVVAEALKDPSDERIRLPVAEQPSDETEQGDSGESPRQLIGQPAAPGVTTGRARLIRTAEDLGRFQAGEVLVCDAIEPTMTHLVPLASAVVERRGGMLIHGAIIARELGIPCVNGIAHATEILRDGEILTVDGYLGIVTVGPPEFSLEGLETEG